MTRFEALLGVVLALSGCPGAGQSTDCDVRQIEINAKLHGQHLGSEYPFVFERSYRLEVVSPTSIEIESVDSTGEVESVKLHVDALDESGADVRLVFRGYGVAASRVIIAATSCANAGDDR